MQLGHVLALSLVVGAAHGGKVPGFFRRRVKQASPE
jgi:hypothetical protein